MAEPDKEQVLKDVVGKIADEMEADVCLYNGPIDEEGLGSLILSASEHKKRDNVLLILVTRGGSGNSAYKIGRFLQTLYTRVAVYVPSYCKSAGTLVALSGHRLILGMFSELGPLDVQLYKKDELWEQRSGLVMRSARTSLAESAQELFRELMYEIKLGSRNQVTFKLASELSARMTTELLSPVYAQMTPMAVGEDYRDLRVAFEYGKRLIGFSRNASEDAVENLVYGYPSHDFVIDREEARGLFKHVDEASPELYRLTSVLVKVTMQPRVGEPLVKYLSEKPAATTQPTEGASNDAASTKEEGNGAHPPQDADGAPEQPVA